MNKKMIRKANLSDAKKIYSLISFWAKDNKMLNRSLNYVYENIRDFVVYEDKERILGCCSLHVIGWDDLGEVKSLSVQKEFLGKGIGRQLVNECIVEATSLGIKKVFALTFVPEFFKKLGFKKINRKGLPHKIWSDCINCASFPDCNEEAVIIKIMTNK